MCGWVGNCFISGTMCRRLFAGGDDEGRTREYGFVMMRCEL